MSDLPNWMVMLIGWNLAVWAATPFVLSRGLSRIESKTEQTNAILRQIRDGVKREVGFD